MSKASNTLRGPFDDESLSSDELGGLNFLILAAETGGPPVKAHELTNLMRWPQGRAKKALRTLVALGLATVSRGGDYTAREVRVWPPKGRRSGTHKQIPLETLAAVGAELPAALELDRKAAMQ